MRSVLAALLVTLTVACAPRAPHPAGPDAVEVAARDEGRVAAVWRARTVAGAGDYCLGPGDLLTVNVFGWDAMRDLHVRVSETGAVSLPLIGDVNASGRTESELQHEIEQRLRANYMRDPHVSVFVQRFQSQQVSVTGAVARPGLYSLTRESRTVYDMLSQAGGLSEQAGGRILFSPATENRCGKRPAADPRGLRPVAATDGASTTAAPSPLEFDIDADVAPGRVNPMLIPVVGGDSIVVTRGRFMVDGWVAKPGLYTFTPGMTAFGAVSVAGGALFPADLKNTEIVRSRRDGTKEVMTVDLASVGHGEGKDITLKEGDVIRFPASAVRMVPYSVYWIFQNLFRVGAGISVAGV